MSLRGVIPDLGTTGRHLFMAPPARERRLYEHIQYTLRGPTLAALPFFERDKIVALLDELPSLDEGAGLRTTRR